MIATDMSTGMEVNPSGVGGGDKSAERLGAGVPFSFVEIASPDENVSCNSEDKEAN
jgi:hypothetical protein